MIQTAESDDSVSIDILLAKIKNPIVSQDAHFNALSELNPKFPQVINHNFELMADKYLLLCNALPGCSPELIVDQFHKVANQIEGIVNQFMDRIKQITKDLEKFANYDTQVLKNHIKDATNLFQKTFTIMEQDVLSEDDIMFLQDHYLSPETQLQSHMLGLIFERNQNLQNVMQKVLADQIDCSNNLKQQIEWLCGVNHFEGLNKLLNSQKQFWTSRVKGSINLQKKLLEPPQQQQQLVQSQAQSHAQAQQANNLQSSIYSSQILPVQNNNQQLIEAMLKLRVHTHDLMVQHVQEMKSKKNKHSKLDGGGSFGYCWTGGYGWRGQSFESLTLNHDCGQCRVLNLDMHQTAKKLYEMEYRDKGTWWVQSWFLYKR